MSKYLPSLEERKLNFLENCCGGYGGGDMSNGPANDGEPPTADSDGGESLIDRTLKTLKSKRKTRKGNGT